MKSAVLYVVIGYASVGLVWLLLAILACVLSDTRGPDKVPLWLSKVVGEDPIISPVAVGLLLFPFFLLFWVFTVVWCRITQGPGPDTKTLICKKCGVKKKRGTAEPVMYHCYGCGGTWCVSCMARVWVQFPDRFHHPVARDLPVCPDPRCSGYLTPQ